MKRLSTRRAFSAAFVIALAAGTVTVPSASAAPDGSNVVINEVYGGGGNNGAVFNKDFVELYNPTDAPIDLTGWKLEQYSTKGNLGTAVELTGSIPAGGFFIIAGKGGDNGVNLPEANLEAGFNFSGTEAIAKLIDVNGEVADLLGWGGATEFESAAAAKTRNATSVQRKEDGKDTDSNADDFKIAAPTPGTSNSVDGSETKDPDPQPAKNVTIAEIQGPSAASPLEGQNVKTRGVVTAVYNEGGRNGFYMQTPGAGKAKVEGDASDAIFVYMGKSAKPEAYPARGSFIEVSGEVEEFNSSTQISRPTVTALDEEFEPVTPVEIESLPEGDEARERYEGMLVKPGVHTVTDNYGFNSYGEMGIVAGTEPLRQPTDFMNPGQEAYELEQAQRESIILLDDASTYNYFRSNKDVPLPYLQTSDKGIKSMRVGDQLEFKDSGVIVEYSFNAWRFQPLAPLTGKSPEEDLPVTWADSRATVRDVPSAVEGELSIGSFNVLNYFTTLGESEDGCEAYEDRFGNKIGTNRCKVRGAYTQDAFEDQQAKIVLAINELDASVVGLMEVENTATTSGDVARRDESLANLVKELNKSEDKWDYVKSPVKLGTDEDFIRVAFIYNTTKVEPVGESIIFDDPAFTGTARQPLAQEFKAVGGSDDATFVAVVNHFKSKGSPANGDDDKNDGQANSAQVRKAQAQALIDHLEDQDQWAGKPVFLLGDLNSYSQEDSIKTLNGAGFELVEMNDKHVKDGSSKASQTSSYAYRSHVGSLDHVLANEAARALIKDAAVWNINADEPIVFQYSRRNYHGADLFQDDNPFAASDHDPVKVGFSQPVPQTPETPENPDPERPEAREIVKAEVDQDGNLWVTFSDAPDTSVNLGQLTGNDGKDGQPGQPGQDGDDGKDGRGIANTAVNNDGELIVTYTDGTEENLGRVTGADGRDGKNGTPGKNGRGVKAFEINDEGHLIVTYTDGTEENLGRVTGGRDGKDGKDGRDGKNGAPGKDGRDGKNGAPGKDGRGVKAFEINDEGHLIVTYTDDKQDDLGKVTGDAGTGKQGQPGQDGDDGKDGRGIANTAVNSDGELIVTYTDGTEENLGRVTGGRDGKNGAPGKDGRGVKAFEINDEGNLIVTYSDGETADLGKVTGDASTGEAGQDGQAGTDGMDGKDGRGIANLEVNDEGELIATYTDGETQNLGRVAGADGAAGKDGKDGAAGKDGKDGANAPAPAPANEGSSVSDRCLPALGIMTLPLLALVPLGLAATMDIPALAPVKEQLNNVGAQLPISPEMQMMAGGVAGTALAVAAIATLAVVCTTEGGSSE